MLMTADEKINELQQILDAKNVENEDLRVRMQKGGGGSASKMPQNEIQHQINAAMQDLQSMRSNPELFAQMAAQKLQMISNLVNKSGQQAHMSHQQQSQSLAGVSVSTSAEQ